MTIPALGLVTIGQAPRADLRPDAEPLLPGVRLVEHGALDGERFDGPAERETRRLLAPEPGEAPLVSRLRDGGSVVLGSAVGAGKGERKPCGIDAIAQCGQCVEQSGPYVQDRHGVKNARF